MLRSFFSVIYWLAIFLALLNFGAVNLLPVVLLAFPIFFMVIVLSALRGPPVYAQMTFALAVLILFCIFGWVAFQTTNSLGGGYASPAWAEARKLVPGLEGTVSVTPADDWAAMLRIAVPFGVFLLGLMLFPTDEDAASALSWLSVVGSVIAALAILQFTVAPRTLLWERKLYYSDSLTAFFVNRNTAATFLGMVILLNCGMVRRYWRETGLGRLLAWLDGQYSLSPSEKQILFRLMAHAACLLVSATALMLTNSRGGVGATFVGLTVFMLLVILRRGSSRRRRRSGRYSLAKIGLSMGFSFTVLLLFLSLAGRMLFRAEMGGLEDGRFCVAKGIFFAIRDHFPAGTGLASFAEIFPAYRPIECGVSGLWLKAHNFYAEGLLTFGFPFVAIAALIVIWLLTCLIGGLARRHRLRFAPEVGIACTVLIIVHSALDFSLQVSGVPIAFAALLAPILTISLYSPPKVRTPGRPVTVEL